MSRMYRVSIMALSMAIFVSVFVVCSSATVYAGSTASLMGKSNSHHVEEEYPQWDSKLVQGKLKEFLPTDPAIAKVNLPKPCKSTEINLLVPPRMSEGKGKTAELFEKEFVATLKEDLRASAKGKGSLKVSLCLQRELYSDLLRSWTEMRTAGWRYLSLRELMQIHLEQRKSQASWIKAAIKAKFAIEKPIRNSQKNIFATAVISPTGTIEYRLKGDWSLGTGTTKEVSLGLFSMEEKTNTSVRTYLAPRAVSALRSDVPNRSVAQASFEHEAKILEKLQAEDDPLKRRGLMDAKVEYEMGKNRQLQAKRIIAPECVPLFGIIHLLTFEQKVEIGYDIAVGLENLHGAGIRHADLKPENVCVQGYVKSDKRPRRVMIFDYNLSVTKEMMVERFRDVNFQPFRRGTRGYVAPEIYGTKEWSVIKTEQKFLALNASGDDYSFGMLLKVLYDNAPPEMMPPEESPMRKCEDELKRIHGFEYRDCYYEAAKPTFQYLSKVKMREMEDQGLQREQALLSAGKIREMRKWHWTYKEHLRFYNVIVGALHPRPNPAHGLMDSIQNGVQKYRLDTPQIRQELGAILGRIQRFPL